MTVLSDGQWRLLESAYSHTTETIAVIAERFGVSPGTVSNRRKKYGWPPRRAGRVKESMEPTVEAVSDQATVIERFYRLINLKLEHLEEDMARSGERTPADNERETRALGTLIRNYEKVAGLEQQRGDGEARSDNGPECQAEAEVIRRELAERLVRLRKAEQGDGD